MVIDWAPFWLIDLLPDGLLSIDAGATVRVLTAFVAVSILISGLDDLFIDLCYYGWMARAALSPERRRPQVSEEELRALPEKPIAVMIPAWHEDAVIGRMLRNTLRSVDYKAFDLFVGVYPNDEATMLAVAEVAEEDARVHRVVLPHDGPTNKADCLNWIIEGIRAYDKREGKGIAILMLHDCEDMVHPLSFRLMNRFIPEADMVQLPVVPFEARAREWTAGTYLDEFAESHLKDMTVRERLSGMVPSAGVGTGFSRAILEELARLHDHQVFNVHTFTEDYDLAFRLKAAGGRSILVQYFTERTEAGRDGRLRVVRELVGTREYFPDHFKDAVRQKARWTLGIVFHGWQQRGWEGGPALRYMIWRDRKTLMTNSVNMVGYLLLLHAALGGGGVAPHSWVWGVILADTALLGNRCLQRVISIARVSSWRQGALSVPRIIWGNVINFFAVAKATRLFLQTAITGKKPVWAKTAHAFPSEDQLRGYKRKLGDLLLEAHAVTLAGLAAGLEAQKGRGGLLGELLVDLGHVSEAALIAALGAQLRIEHRLVDPAAVPAEALDLLSEHACREHRMVVLDPAARPVPVAAADPGDARLRAYLDANLHAPYRLVLSGRRAVIAAVESCAARRAAAEPMPPPQPLFPPQTRPSPLQ
jgi:adsorption protein B